MTLLKPHFHLQRVDADGNASKPEVYRVHDLPASVNVTRRGLFDIGITASALLAISSGTSRAADPPGVRDESRGTLVSAHGTPVNAHRGTINGLAFSTDGKHLVSVAADSTIKLWDISNFNLLYTQTQKGHNFSAVVTSAAASSFIVGSDAAISRYEGTSIPPTLAILNAGIFTSLATTSDGRGIVAGDRLGKISLRTPYDRNAIGEWQAHQGTVTCLAVTPNGRGAVSGSNDFTIRLWSLSDRKEIGRFADDTGGSITALAITANGSGLVSASKDLDIRLWSLPRRKQVGKLKGHENEVLALAMIPERMTLASGSRDTTVRIWSLSERRTLHTFMGHAAAVSALAASPDGKLLASGDANGVIMIWDLDEPKLNSYLFDATVSQTNANVYYVRDDLTGRKYTYTLPCGSAVPPGATCTCNCVPGTYRPAELSVAPYTPPATYTPPPPYRPTAPAIPYSPPRSYGGGSCSCNKICTCIPVCQSFQLLSSDPVVRTMAEELLLTMGLREFAYMNWAANRSSSRLSDRIRQMMDAVHRGVQPSRHRWPSMPECAERLNHHDEVVRIMAAQMITQSDCQDVVNLDENNRAKVNRLLARAVVRNKALIALY